MKIVEARTTVVGTPWRELTFLELATDQGLTGIGEVRMVNKTDTLLACIGELAPRYVIGIDPFDLERLAWNVQRAEYGRPGEVTQSALSAFDIACWDLMGQALRVPIWKLLGGRFRDRVPAYANGWYQAERDPAAIAALARTVVGRRAQAGSVRRGQRRARRVRSAPRRSDRRRGARRGRPNVQILIEMHGRFTPATAVRVAALLERYDPEWIEEPVPPENAAALGRVRAGTRIPIATGERAHTIAECRELVEGGYADILQADLTHFGGFLAMKHLARWADTYHLLLAPHNVCGPVGTTPTSIWRRPRPTTRCSSTSTISPTPGCRTWSTRLRAWPSRTVLRCARASGPRRGAQSNRVRGPSAHRRTPASLRGWMGASRLPRHGSNTEPTEHTWFDGLTMSGRSS